MGSVQTSYSQTMTAKLAGMLWDARTFTAESFAAEAGAISFGYAVVIGADAAKTVKIPTATGQGFRGIAMHEQSQMQAVSTGTVAYAQYDVVNVLRKGAIWVLTVGTVSADEPAFFVATGGSAGKFSNVDDSTTDTTHGFFRTSVTGAGLAVVEINLPHGFYSGS